MVADIRVDKLLTPLLDGLIELSARLGAGGTDGSTNGRLVESESSPLFPVTAWEQTMLCCDLIVGHTIHGTCMPNGRFSGLTDVCCGLQSARWTGRPRQRWTVRLRPLSFFTHWFLV